MLCRDRWRPMSLRSIPLFVTGAQCQREMAQTAQARVLLLQEGSRLCGLPVASRDRSFCCRQATHMPAVHAKPVRLAGAVLDRMRLGYAQEAADAPGGGGGAGAVVIEPWPAGYHAQCALLCRGGWVHRVERGAPWRPVRPRSFKPYPVPGWWYGAVCQVYLGGIPSERHCTS